MDKFSVIAEYEKKHDLQEEDCYVQYIRQYDAYMQKMGIPEELIDKRYYLALEERKIEEKKKEITGVYKIVGKHNLKDESKYSSENLEHMLHDFFHDSYVRKEIGVEIDHVYYPLMVYRESVGEIELEILEDSAMRNSLIQIQRDWFLKWNEMNNQKIIEKTNAVLAVSSALAAKQDRINYTKEFRKVVNTSKCVIGCRLEEYDLREIDLSNHIFINCNFTYANFSHCNLSNTFFVNCDLTNACFYGALLNGCIRIQGESMDIKDEYKMISGYSAE